MNVLRRNEIHKGCQYTEYNKQGVVYLTLQGTTGKAGNGKRDRRSGNGERKQETEDYYLTSRVMDGWAVDSDLSSVDELRSSRD